MIGLDKISGFGNPGGRQQFYQTNATAEVEMNFYAFVPVNGDVTFDYLKEVGRVTNVASAYCVSGNFYQNVVYTGSFESFILATGEVIVYLTQQ